ncbi:MAG: cytidine deaminase [Prevotella sp.]|nr:cytidine deaminase [Prevotella sp.]
MNTIEIKIQVEYRLINELSDSDRELIEAAKKATDNSYSPYSHFRVGAALRLSDGRIVIGANQENAAFPSGLCAERSAIFAAQSNWPEQSIESIAIAARNENGFVAVPVSPCGSCRQVMLEMEERYKHPIRVLLYGTQGVHVINSVKDLLPLCFVDANMR